MIQRQIPRNSLPKLLAKIRRQKKRIVFTNGVFDIIHRGHVEYLSLAKSYGDILIVGLNSDASVKRLKGPKRPLQKQNDRAIILSAIKPVDYVVLFGEDTPLKLIKEIKPDILAKGADYKTAEIVGADFVKENGGRVKRIRLTRGKSSTKIIKLI